MVWIKMLMTLEKQNALFSLVVYFLIFDISTATTIL